MENSPAVSDYKSIHSSCGEDPILIRNTLIRFYHGEGYGYQQIVDFLLHGHGLSISIRHLKRILVTLGLKRKMMTASPELDVLQAILIELQGAGDCLGYKSLWLRLQQTYGLNIRRDRVLEILRVVDPEGVEGRKIRRLRRRQYITPGPNFLWHLDGYDKLKPYGFPIHGCIDGWSRKLLWLQVSSTNNHPDVVAHFYLDTVRKLGFVPRVIRSDRGTENGTIQSLQQCLRFYHDDQLAGLNSFIQGKSTANQRIESFWSQLRRAGIDHYISLFKDMRDSFVFDNSNPIHIECIRYCFGPLILYELQQILEEWNKHSIRKQKNREGPVGKPNHLFECAPALGSRNFKKEISLRDVDILIHKHTIEPALIRPSFVNIVNLLLPDLNQATNDEEAFENYMQILDVIDKYQNNTDSNTEE
ncbi:uncharacterized protein LOC122849012 isoform X2 [Aphidius gifuensis]|nr:uncharacterized protein LOC122849012 isoform X2 [Aphidius gifuensis]